MSTTNKLPLLPSTPTLLTVAETADIARVTPWWVRRLIASGELRAINIGGTGTRTRWRIYPEDLHAWALTRENRRRDLVA